MNIIDIGWTNNTADIIHFYFKNPRDQDAEETVTGHPCGTPSFLTGRTRRGAKA